VLGLDLQVPYALRSADDLKTPYTNYTSGYQALLDYVWYPPQRLRVTQQLAVPSPEQMTGYIPNAAFPSDHLAVVYDLEPGAAQQ
jgi:mRNA deadenylase 3'-5' endonuclease subunit Ccr4